MLHHHRRKPDWLRHEVLRLKAHMPRAGCRAVAVNNTWAMDTTFFTDADKTTHAAIGLIDHGSRLALRLHTLTRRCS